MKKKCLILLALLLVSTVFAGTVSASVNDNLIVLQYTTNNIDESCSLYLCGATLTCLADGHKLVNYTSVADVYNDDISNDWPDRLVISEDYGFSLTSDYSRKSDIIVKLPMITEIAREHKVDQSNIISVTLHFLLKRVSDSDLHYIYCDKFSIKKLLNQNTGSNLIKIGFKTGTKNDSDYTKYNTCNCVSAQIRSEGCLPSITRYVPRLCTQDTIDGKWDGIDNDSSEPDDDTNPDSHSDPEPVNPQKYTGIVDPNRRFGVYVAGDLGYWNTLELTGIDCRDGDGEVVHISCTGLKWNDECGQENTAHVNIMKDVKRKDSIDLNNITDMYLQFKLIRKSCLLFTYTNQFTIILSSTDPNVRYKINENTYHIPVEHTYKRFAFDYVCFTTDVSKSGNPDYEKSFVSVPTVEYGAQDKRDYPPTA